MNRRIAMSAMSIVGALAVAGGTTFAAFTSEASNNNNTFGAGELVLTLDAQAGSSSTAFFTLPSGQVPGVQTDHVLVLGNTGTVPAAEVEVSGIDLNSGTNFAALAAELVLTFWTDTDSDGEIDGGETIHATEYLSNSAYWTDRTLAGVTLPASGSQTVKAKLAFDLDAPNTVQGASLNFDINFRANQVVTP